MDVHHSPARNRSCTSVLDLLTKAKTSSQLAKDTLSLVGSKLPDTTATTKALEDVKRKWDDAARSASNYFDTSKTGAETFDWKAYLKGAEESLQDAQKVKGEIFKVPVEIAQEAQRIYKDKGAAAALAYVTAFEKEGPAVKKRMQTVAVAASEDAGDAAGVAFGQSAQSAWDNELRRTSRPRRRRCPCASSPTTPPSARGSRRRFASTSTASSISPAGGRQYDNHTDLLQCHRDTGAGARVAAGARLPESRASAHRRRPRHHAYPARPAQHTLRLLFITEPEVLDAEDPAP